MALVQYRQTGIRWGMALVQLLPNDMDQVLLSVYLCRHLSCGRDRMYTNSCVVAVGKELGKSESWSELSQVESDKCHAEASAAMEESRKDLKSDKDGGHGGGPAEMTEVPKTSELAHMFQMCDLVQTCCQYFIDT